MKESEHNMKESEHNRGIFSKSILGKFSSIIDGGLHTNK